MRIRKDSPAFDSRRKKDIDLNSRDKCPVFNVELKDSEAIQLLVPASIGQTCVHLEVVSGELQIIGGASIIDLIDVDGYVRIKNDSHESTNLPTGLRSITELSEFGDEKVQALQKNGAVTASNLALWTFDGVESLCGIEFATKAQDWLKSLGLTMRCQ